MAVRLPLVIGSDGLTQQLQTGDTLSARVATSRISVRYESDLPIPTERGRPFALAWARAAENLSEGAALVLTVLVTLAPFALAGIAIAVAWRWLRRRFDWTQARDAMS